MERGARDFAHASRLPQAFLRVGTALFRFAGREMLRGSRLCPPHEIAGPPLRLN
jgi:hypothetical protein